MIGLIIIHQKKLKNHQSRKELNGLDPADSNLGRTLNQRPLSWIIC